MKKLLVIFTIYFTLLSGNLSSEENTSFEQKPTIKSIEKQISFNISNNTLENHARVEQILRIKVEGNEHLVLHYASRGRKQRGNALLFHAEGESPANSRLIKPLVSQLTNLGWNLFVPNIAKEDYPKSILMENKGSGLVDQESSQTSETENDNAIKTNSSADEATEKGQYFFNDSAAYQDYFISLCKAIFEQTKLLEQSTLLIANQHGAYWSINCLQHTKQTTPIVLLAALLPDLPKNDLAEKFAVQTSPVYSFKLDDSTKSEFDRVFDKRIWNSNFQRTNIGMLSPRKLSIEDDSIARSITGWIEKQRKNNLGSQAQP